MDPDRESLRNQGTHRVSMHHVTTSDGVTIGGTVHGGEGKPLVFVHGALGDGDIGWEAVARLRPAPYAVSESDPVLLKSISTPVLVLHGSATTPFGSRSARHVATHAPNSQIRVIHGAGHAASLTRPTALAETLSDIFG